MSLVINRSGDISDLKGVISRCFTEIEMQDQIVRYVYANANTMKKIILNIPEEIRFDYIPNGIGYICTAYLKFHPGLKDNTLKLTTDKDAVVLKLELKH